MAQFHETVGGRKFYDADVPRAIKALEGLQKAVEQLVKAAQPVAPAPAPEAKCGEETECECDNTHDQNDTVCRYCWAKGRRRPSDPTPEAKCGENICCDDPDCAEREDKDEARSIAIQNYESDDIEFDNDAAVDFVFSGSEDDLQVTGAWVAARVWVEFTANKGGE